MNPTAHNELEKKSFQQEKPNNGRVAFTYDLGGGNWELVLAKDTSRSKRGKSYENKGRFYYTNQDKMFEAAQQWEKFGKRPPLDHNETTLKQQQH